MHYLYFWHIIVPIHQGFIRLKVFAYLDCMWSVKTVYSECFRVPRQQSEVFDIQSGLRRSKAICLLLSHVYDKTAVGASDENVGYPFLKRRPLQTY